MKENDQELMAERLLAYLYIAQQYSFFGDLAMRKLIQKLEITEEELRDLLKECIEKDWLYVKNFNPAHYLRPGRVQYFPVIISSGGIRYLKENNLMEGVSLDLGDVTSDEEQGKD